MINYRKEIEKENPKVLKKSSVLKNSGLLYGFTKESWEFSAFDFPCEDAYNINPEIQAIVVADGVTRDPFLNIDKRTPEGKASFFKSYPRPSPAAKVANLLCTRVPAMLLHLARKDEYGIREAFQETNKQIKSWNERNIPNPDYLVNDFGGCVAAVAVREHNNLYWGFMCDAGIAITDEQGNLKFKTPDEGPDNLQHPFWGNFEIKRDRNKWKDPETRRLIRSHYRNNPEERNSFGVFTGEAAAMNYVKTGSYILEKGDIVMAYTDGLSHILFSEDTRRIQPRVSHMLKSKNLAGIEDLCAKEVASEGTLTLMAEGNW